MRTDPRLAPIALFIYRRPAHVAATIASLRACAQLEQSRVIVFADGPKGRGDEGHVHEARSAARELLGDQAEIRESPHNKGLASSIVQGTTEVARKYGRVIVIEDDLIVGSDFLAFMNQALDRYADDSRVMQISGHMFRLKDKSPNRLCFLPVTTSWGWATWQRAWQHYTNDLSDARAALRDPATRFRFNVGGTCDNSGMLKKQLQGKIDSWAIAWCWHVFRLNGLVLYPRLTKVLNKGFDAEATHGFRTVDVSALNQSENVPQARYEWPPEIATDEACLREFMGAHRTAHRGVLARLKLLKSRLFF